jgi:hypothetical protein
MNQLKKIKPITALANVTMRTNAVFSIKKYFLILAFIIFISVMLFIAYTDPGYVAPRRTYIRFRLIPLLFLFLYIQKISPLGGDSKFTPVFYGILEYWY